MVVENGYQSFGRKIKLIAGSADTGGGKEWTDLRISFLVEKDDNLTPDKAQIQIYNLNETSRKYLTLEMPIVLQAGYGENLRTLFKGTIDKLNGIEHLHAKPDLITKIKATDGGLLWDSNSAISFKTSTTIQNCIQQLALSAGFNIGYIDPELPVITLKRGYCMVGYTHAVLSDLADMLGAVSFIQDGLFYVVKQGNKTQEKMVLLTPDSGLIGSPEAADLSADKGTKTKVKALKIVCLLNGLIKPRKALQLKSTEYDGIYIPKKVKHEGDSGWDNEFYTTIEAING